MSSLLAEEIQVSLCTWCSELILTWNFPQLYTILFTDVFTGHVLCRSAGVRFSFQTGDGQQALKKDVLLRRLTSSSNTPLPNDGRKPLCPLEIELEITPTKPQSPAAGDLSPWPQITLEDSSKIVPATPPAQKQNFQVHNKTYFDLPQCKCINLA